MPAISKLPQNKEEYRDLKRHHKNLNRDLDKIDIDIGKNQTKVEAEPEIAPMVERLLSKNLKKETVQEQLVNFFRAYDDYQEDRIMKL